MASVEPVNHFDRLIRSIPIGVYRIRTTLQGEMRFEYVNQWFCDMLGVSAYDLYQNFKKLLEKVHPEEIDAFVQLYREAISNKKTFNWEGRFVVGGDDLLLAERFAGFGLNLAQNNLRMVIWFGVVSKPMLRSVNG